MPLYPYACDACGTTETDWASIQNHQDTIECPKCGEAMHRTYAGTGPYSPETPYQHPIEMYSLAPNTPAEVMAFRKANPDVRLNDQLVPIARSRAEKDRIMESVGYEEKN